MVHPFILRHIISVTKRDSIRSRQIQYGKNKNPIVVMGIPFRSPKRSRMGHRLEPQTGLVLWPLRYSTGKIKIPLLWWGPKTGGYVFFSCTCTPRYSPILGVKSFWSVLERYRTDTLFRTCRFSGKLKKVVHIYQIEGSLMRATRVTPRHLRCN